LLDDEVEGTSHTAYEWPKIYEAISDKPHEKLFDTLPESEYEYPREVLSR
jgi:hypothetical protein